MKFAIQATHDRVGRRRSIFETKIFWNSRNTNTGRIQQSVEKEKEAKNLRLSHVLPLINADRDCYTTTRL